MGCEMDWPADVGGFPYTLDRCPMGGRRGADDAAGGLFAAAPQGGYGLVSTLPLAGDADLWTAGAGKVLCPRGPRAAHGTRRVFLFRATALLAVPSGGGKAKGWSNVARGPHPSATHWTGRRGNETATQRHFVPPAKGSVETSTFLPYDAATRGRQPRCQRRVARLRPQGTLWTESRPRPRASPFRVLLPWPPGGGLGAGG